MKISPSIPRLRMPAAAPPLPHTPSHGAMYVFIILLCTNITETKVQFFMIYYYAQFKFHKIDGRSVAPQYVKLACPHVITGNRVMMFSNVNTYHVFYKTGLLIQKLGRGNTHWPWRSRQLLCFLGAKLVRRHRVCVFLLRMEN